MHFFCPMCGADLGDFGDGVPCGHVVYRWNAAPSRESGVRAFDPTCRGDERDPFRALEATWKEIVLWLFPDDELVNEGLEPQQARAAERLGELMTQLPQAMPDGGAWWWPGFLSWLPRHLDELTDFQGDDDDWELARDAAEAIGLWWHEGQSGSLTLVDWMPDGDAYRHYGFAFAGSPDEARSYRQDFLGTLSAIARALQTALESARSEQQVQP